MRKSRLWIVSELFYPDQASTGYIMTEIASALSAEKEIHVLCGPSGYDDIISSSVNKEFQFKIHRVRTLNISKNKLFGRIIRMLSLSLNMFFSALFSFKRSDKVLMVTNPAFIVPFMALLRKIRGFELFMLVHDVFPENLRSAGLYNSKKSLSFRFLKTLFDRSYRTANYLIVLGRDMFEVVADKIGRSDRIFIIENWADSTSINPASFSDNPLVRKLQLQDKIVFAFAGNLGRVQGLEFLFKLIAKIKSDLPHFLFIGAGAIVPELKDFVKRNKLSNVTFAGPMAREDQQIFLNASHMGLVTLEASLYGLGVPSKSYNILAAGRPILFIGHKGTEISRMVQENHCGLVFDPTEEVKLLEFFEGLDEKSPYEFEKMGGRGRELAEQRYSKHSILNRFKEILV